MFCANCGTKQNEGEKFCPNCGTKFEEPQIVNKEVSNDASKQSTTKKGKVTLSKEKVAKKSEAVIDVTKVSDFVNEKEHNSKNVSMSKKNIKTEGKEEKEVKIESPKPTVKVNKDMVVDNSQLKEHVEENNITITNEKKEVKDVGIKTLGGGNNDNGESLESGIKNDSMHNPNKVSNTIQYEPINSDKCENDIKGIQDRSESIVKEYENLFEKIENKLHLVDIDKSKQTGIISDRISIIRKVFYESKKKYHDESSLVYVETLCMYKFKVYIAYDAKNVNDIKQKIKKYNNLVVGYGYNSIQFNEKKLFVEGRFIQTKRGANVGFLKSLLISDDDIKREQMFERLFREIYNLCESIKA